MMDLLVLLVLLLLPLLQVGQQGCMDRHSLAARVL
jgi:hypothetical protein